MEPKSDFQIKLLKTVKNSLLLMSKESLLEIYNTSGDLLIVDAKSEYAKWITIIINKSKMLKRNKKELKYKLVFPTGMPGNPNNLLNYYATNQESLLPNPVIARYLKKTNFHWYIEKIKD